MTSSVIIREYKYLLSYSFIYIYIQFISRCSLPSPPQESLIHHPNLPSPTSPLPFPTPFIYLFITSPQPSIHFIHPIIPTLPNSSYHQPSIQVTISNISNPPSLPHSRVPQLSSMQIYKPNSHYTHIHTYTQAHKHYKAHYPLPITHHPYLPSPTSQYIPPIPKRLTYTYTYLLPLPNPVHYLSHHSHFPQFPLPSHLSQFSLPIPNPQSSILNLQSPISFPHQPPNPVSPSVHKSTPLLHSTPLHSTPALKNPPFLKNPSNPI